MTVKITKAVREVLSFVPVNNGLSPDWLDSDAIAHVFVLYSSIRRDPDRTQKKKKKKASHQGLYRLYK